MIDYRYPYRAEAPAVTVWRREITPSKREQRRQMWLYAPPKRCRGLILALRWCWWNRAELLTLALCLLAVVAAGWAAKMMIAGRV